MTSRVVTIHMDDPVGIAKEIFDAMKFHHLLVVDSDGKLAGVMSDRDLLKALSPYVGTAAENARDLATLNKRAHQIMSRNPITLPPDADIRDATKLILAARISCVPVVDAAFKPVGILTWRDLLRSLAG
jgi:acetoin utilization protein AcuB